MPQYKKVFDIGTYTGNGGQYRVGIPTLRGVGPTGSQIAGSLRFRNSVPSYLTKTPGSTSNQKTWTWSAWTKLGKINSTAYLFTSGNTGSITTNYILFGYSTSGFANNTDTIQFLCTAGNVGKLSFQSTAIYRDVSQWNHIMVAVDTTQATSTNRVKIYLNGVQVTSWATATYPSQNYDIDFWNTSSYPHYIGHIQTYGEYDGYMSEVYFVDGQQLTPSSFGEYNTDGIWVPKIASGLTYGTNGYYLPMSNTTNFYTDASGRGNNWTPTGFNATTANATYDIMTDSPTDYLSGSMTTANNSGNYATFNATTTATGYPPTNGNLTYTSPGGWLTALSTLGVSSGKWYVESTLTLPGGSFAFTGIMKSSAMNSIKSNYYLGQDTNSYGWQVNNYYYNNVATAGPSMITGDIIMMAFDVDAGKLWWGKNGTWNAGDPATGTSPIYSSITADTWHFGVSHNTGSIHNINFGQRPFSYTAPSGFKALNTYNYPRPADSSMWFYGDVPDLMWIKNRSTTGLHTITDTVRGAGLNLVTSSTAAETSYPAVSEMNKFGMSVINDGTSIVNGSGNSMVYWAWKAGSNTSSSSVTNTDGTITSQVSANRQAGFSIVSYTGNGSTNQSVGHGLGAAPGMVMIKQLDGTASWIVHHQSQATGYTVYLNLTNAQDSGSSQWGTSAQTSSLFYVGYTVGATGSNVSGSRYIAYCWAPIPGYSAFGSYTGNGNADGPFVYLGFRPKWILLSRTDAAHQWYIHDTTRDTYNVAGSELYPNLTNSEAAATRLDFLSNGIKLRTTGTDHNASGGTYIYAAFAEIPFKFSRAR